MTRFRYYLDFGSGYQLVNVYNNNLQLVSDKSISLSFETKKLKGDITFVGINANQAFAKRAAGYFIPFKIEENVNNVWHVLYECYADIRGDYLYQSKLLKIDNFKTKASIYDKIISGLNNKFTLRNNIPFYSISQNVTSKRLDIYSIPTSLSYATYMNQYTLEGEPVTLNADPRWVNFRYYSTTGTTPNLVHRYSIQSFDYLPGIVDGWNGYNPINYQDTIVWVKDTPPPDPYTDELFNTTLLRRSHSLTDTLNYLVNGLDSSVSFLQLHANQLNLNADYQYLGYSDDFNLNEVKDIQISLKEIFDFLLIFYNNAWYVESGYLKFKTAPYFLFNSILDLTTKQIDKDKITFVYDPMPDKEIWKSQDVSLEPWVISYFQKNILTDNITFEYVSPFLHDFWYLKKKLAPSGKFAFFPFINSIQTIPTFKDLYDLYAGQSGYSEYAPFYIKSDASQLYGNVRPDVYDTRPIYKYEFDINLTSYYNFDLFQKINFANGNSGYLNKYTINLKNGIAKFEVHFDTLNF